MELIFLGSSNAFAAEGRYWSSFMVDRRYLFDAPPTLLPHLKRLEIPAQDLDVIFLTHWHGDHFVGLPFLMLEYTYMTPRDRDLYIVGPNGAEERMERFAETVYPNVTKDAGYKRIYVDAHDGKDGRAGDLEFHAIRMNHVSESMHAMGYRVRFPDKTVAYTGDTMYCDEIMDLADGADILVVDCTYTEGPAGPEHMGLDDIKRIRERISPDTSIVLTHMNSLPVLNGLNNTLVAEDFKTFRFS